MSVLAVLAMGVSGVGDISGWFDGTWLGLGGAAAVLLSTGIEALLRSREGRPVWDDEPAEGDPAGRDDRAR